MHTAAARRVQLHPYTLHPAPCTLHPAPCTLHPAPCTLHPGWHPSRGLHIMVSSPKRRRIPLGPYRRHMPRVLGKSSGGGRFLMGEVPLYHMMVYSASGWSASGAMSPKASAAAISSPGGPRRSALSYEQGTPVHVYRYLADFDHWLADFSERHCVRTSEIKHFYHEDMEATPHFIHLINILAAPASHHGVLSVWLERERRDVPQRLPTLFTLSTFLSSTALQQPWPSALAHRGSPQSAARPCTLHLAPCTLHPALCTLHPAPWMAPLARLSL